MTHRRERRPSQGRANEPIDCCGFHTPLGPATAAAQGEALIGFWFDEDRHYPRETAHWRPRADHPTLLALQEWVTRYFAGENIPFPFLLEPVGTPFQRIVWEELRRIPYGQLTTYGALAKGVALRMGREHMSARAVGGSVGRNRINLLIPCHRVVGADGSLTGYGGGLHRKEALLRLENSLPD